MQTTANTNDVAVIITNKQLPVYLFGGMCVPQNSCKHTHTRIISRWL